MPVITHFIATSLKLLFLDQITCLMYMKHVKHEGEDGKCIHNNNKRTLMEEKKTLAGALNPGISLANIRHLMHAAHCKQTMLWGGAHY